VNAPKAEREMFGGAVVLLVRASASGATLAARALDAVGVKARKVAVPAEALELIRGDDFDVIIGEMKMDEATGLELLKIAKTFRPETDVVLLDRSPSVGAAVRVLSQGASGYVTEDNFDALASSLRAVLAKRALASYDSPARQPEDSSFGGIVGASDCVRGIFQLIRKVAPSTAPVLIQGESGTGKELIARAIHDNSPRRDRRFLAINSASLPETLLESELFGYRRGAFTGAQTDKIGLLESADGGSVLLDEIGSMSKQLQSKLLRAMEEGEIMPVGSTERVKVDVRFLAASNRDLWEMVLSDEFRKELYYRLNVIEIDVPPLRDRKEDIPLLTEHFLRKHCGDLGVQQKSVGKAALRKLLGHRWPGNVRELENVIRRAIILSKGPVILARDVQLQRSFSASASERADLLSMPYHRAKGVVEREFQKAYVSRLLSRSGGKMKEAAQRSGLSRQSIHQIAKRHGLK